MLSSMYDMFPRLHPSIILFNSSINDFDDFDSESPAQSSQQKQSIFCESAQKQWGVTWNSWLRLTIQKFSPKKHSMRRIIPDSKYTSMWFMRMYARNPIYTVACTLTSAHIQIVTQTCMQSKGDGDGSSHCKYMTPYTTKRKKKREIITCERFVILVQSLFPCILRETLWRHRSVCTEISWWQCLDAMKSRSCVMDC